MSDESDRMMVLLQELAALKREKGLRSSGIRKRRKEISEEMKQLALEKVKSEE